MTWKINGGSPGIGYEVTEKTVTLFNGFQVESTLTMVSIIRNKSSEIVCNASNSLGSIQSVSNVIIDCKSIIFISSSHLHTSAMYFYASSSFLSPDSVKASKTEIYLFTSILKIPMFIKRH